jgi:hypothetical protein
MKLRDQFRIPYSNTLSINLMYPNLIVNKTWNEQKIYHSIRIINESEYDEIVYNSYLMSRA